MPLVDVVATVQPFGGTTEVTSPVSGARGLLIHLELFEDERGLGEIVLGDTIELHADDGRRWVVVARRAQLGFVDVRRETVVDAAPPELVPLLVRSRGGRRLLLREHVVRAGDRLRVRAHVDERGALREDLGPVRLDEMLAI